MIRMLDQFLIGHCSPTLAGLKTANLFQYPMDSTCDAQIAIWNRLLNPRGVSLAVLLRDPDRALVYVYRHAMLQHDLHHQEVTDFLSALGYDCVTPESALSQLRQRIAQSQAFPHEIGLFLGYPLADVIGFIENSGENCLLCGFWKVYCDVCNTRKLFAKYRKCMQVYLRLFGNGTSIQKLTIAAS